MSVRPRSGAQVTHHQHSLYRCAQDRARQSANIPTACPVFAFGIAKNPHHQELQVSFHRERGRRSQFPSALSPLTDALIPTGPSWSKRRQEEPACIALTFGMHFTTNIRTQKASSGMQRGRYTYTGLNRSYRRDRVTGVPCIAGEISASMRLCAFLPSMWRKQDISRIFPEWDDLGRTPPADSWVMLSGAGDDATFCRDLAAAGYSNLIGVGQ